MEEKNREKKRPGITGKQGWAVVAGLLLAAGLLCWGIYTTAAGMLRQAQIRAVQQEARQSCLWMEASETRQEAALVSWAEGLRGGRHTQIQDLLNQLQLGGQVLNCRELYLAEGSLLFYSGAGFLGELPAYSGLLETMDGDRITISHRDDGGDMALLVMLRLKPLTVEENTFRYVVAEFSPEGYFGEVGDGCILDGSGNILMQRGQLPALPGTGSSWSLYKTEGQEGVVVQEKPENRDWSFVTWRILEPLNPGTSGILALILALEGIALAVFAVALVLLMRHEGVWKRAVRAEAEEKHLRQALETAEQTVRMQTEFQGRISHDIRTPLSTIVGYTTLAERHSKDPAVGENLERIQEASRQLLAQLEQGLGTEREESEPEIALEEKPVELTGRRILLVEDNALNREMGMEVLTEAGMEVDCAENGEEGFRKVATSKPGYYDLVLMDIQMPVMDGCEAASTIRRLRTRKLAEIPIIALTADVSEQTRQRVFQAEMDGFVGKPADFNRLLAVMRNALRK